tara:strand:- start:111 stop:683 length:573 start_codon:yes stop_codon:yes gene_type:complete
MSRSNDWKGKLQESVDRVKSGYETVGRGTGARFLAIVYPPDEELAVLREWKVVTRSLEPDYIVHSIDIMHITNNVVSEIGAETIASEIQNPTMAGSSPITDLANLWLDRIVEEIRKCSEVKVEGRIVISLERLAALYPVAGPRDLMQRLWDSDWSIPCPVIFLIPGHLKEARVYSFLDKQDEFLYRGVII